MSSDDEIKSLEEKMKDRYINEEEEEEESDQRDEEEDEDETNAKGLKRKRKDMKDESASKITSSNTSFKKLGISDILVKACNDLGWTKPTPIQELTIPYGLNGRDIVALAETGSGKTGAFTLPLLESLLVEPQRLYAVILAPTRELAVQIHQVVSSLGAAIGASSVCVVGGIDQMSQAVALAKKPHVVVATPGRLIDHLENTKGFNLRNLKMLILDEADRMLSMDFEEEINKLLMVIPKDRRTFLFSATMTSKVEKLQRASLKNPARVQISSHKYHTVKSLVQEFILAPAKFKDCYLVFLLNEFAGQTALIFTGTCANAQRISIMLQVLGLKSRALHGKMQQTARLGALNKFKLGNCNILVATDVASRGLDIPAVDLVINYDVPQNGKDYVHRVGRTARAGRSGRAISIVSQYDLEAFQRVEKNIDKKLQPFPAEKEIVLEMLERVSEAQRMTTLELREAEEKRLLDSKSGSRKSNHQHTKRRKRW